MRNVVALDPIFRRIQRRHECSSTRAGVSHKLFNGHKSRGKLITFIFYVYIRWPRINTYYKIKLKWQSNKWFLRHHHHHRCQSVNVQTVGEWKDPFSQQPDASFIVGTSEKSDCHLLSEKREIESKQDNPRCCNFLTCVSDSHRNMLWRGFSPALFITVSISCFRSRLSQILMLLRRYWIYHSI